jgi:hypothetical protein
MKKQQERKGLAITGLIIAILALIGSWVPIINNVSFIFAVIALIFGLIALYINRKGKKTITIIAIALSVASGAIVLITQQLYSASKSVSKSISSASSSVSKDVSASSSSSNATPKSYNAGDIINQADGMQVKVNSVNFSSGDQFEVPDSGKQYVIVNVTLTNNGSKNLTYNPWDFNLSDNGNNTNFDAILTSVTDLLQSGSLSPKGTVTGNMVGQATIGGTLKLVSLNSLNQSTNWTINLQ